MSNSSDSLGPGAGIENSSDSLESGTGIVKAILCCTLCFKYIPNLKVTRNTYGNSNVITWSLMNFCKNTNNKKCLISARVFPNTCYYLCTKQNSLSVHSINCVGETTTVQLNCSSDFFLDKGTGLCRPDCGEWNQYSLWRERAVYGVDSSFTALAVLIDTITLVVSCVRYKIM